MKRALLLALVLAACAKKGGDRSREDVTASDPMKPETPTNTGGAPDKGGPGGAGSGGEPVGGTKRGLDLDQLLGGDLEISVGAIGKDVVRRVIKDNVGKLTYCYEQTLLANPGIEGVVMAKFTIEAGGSVSDVKCAGVHPEVEACVEKAVKDMKFPPQANKVEVQYPFTFKPA